MKNKIISNIKNKIGIAILATFLGSNIQYALDNYEIISNNLSHAAYGTSSGTDDSTKVNNTMADSKESTSFFFEEDPLTPGTVCKWMDTETRPVCIMATGHHCPIKWSQGIRVTITTLECCYNKEE